MRILIDECLPRQIKAWLAGSHEAVTVEDVGWRGIKNGALLREADARFDVLLTADQQMYHQQNFTGLRISVVVLPTNRLRMVREAIPALLQSLEHAEPGQRITMELGGETDQWGQLRLDDILPERVSYATYSRRRASSGVLASTWGYS